MNVMTEEFKRLVEFCVRVSRDESLVQGPGGNASVKVDGRMLVKASGCLLHEVSLEKGFVQVDVNELIQFYASPFAADVRAGEVLADKAHMAAVRSGEGRPSMEAGFHALLGAVVFHTHPVYVNVLTCMADGERIVRELFSDEDVLWVGYRSPGYALTKEVQRVLGGRSTKGVRVLFLENHGLIVSADSVAACEREFFRVVRIVEEFVRSRGVLPYAPCVLREVEEGFESDISFDEFFATNAGKSFLFPDAIVYGLDLALGRDCGVARRDGALSFRMERSRAQSIGQVLNAHAYLAREIGKVGLPKVLTEEEVAHVYGMPAEQYRRAMGGMPQANVSRSGVAQDAGASAGTVSRSVTIVIPMTGIGRRFLDAGYKDPKPLIVVEGKPMIQHVLNMFAGESRVVLIVNEDHLRYSRLAEVLREVAPHATVVVEKDHQKKGPAYHVLLAHESIDDDAPVIVSYCDFFVDWDYADFKQSMVESNPDGAVMTYIGFHPSLLGPDLYGSLLTDDDGVVTHYREKHSWTANKMDCHQSAGAYYFRSGKVLKEYLRRTLVEEKSINGEHYVSQAYNVMQRDGLRSVVYPVRHFCQWGTPRDLEEYQFWSQVFHKMAREPRTFKYWSDFFARMEWHPFGKGGGA